MGGTPHWFRLALVAACVVPALLFAGAAWFDHNQILDREIANARSTVGILHEHMLKVLDTNDQLVHEVDRRIHAMTWDEIRANRDRLATELQVMIANRPQISAMGLTDGTGIEWVASTLAGSPQPPRGFDASQQDYWLGQRDADRGAFVTRAYIGAHTRRENFAISQRRTSTDGSFDGTIHISVAVSYFVDFWEKAMHGQPDTQIMLVRTDGEILAHSPAPETSPRRLTRQNSPLAEHLSPDPDGAVYTTISAIDGIESIYACATTESYPLIIVYRRSVASVLVTWHQRLIVLGGICTLAAMALTGTMLLAMRQARRLGEEQTRRAAAERIAIEGQRLEILGQLVAGVAHDFNNVVHVVEAGARMIKEKATDEPTRKVALWVGEAAEQGRWLTRRMLDFARDGDPGQEGTNPSVHPAETVSSVTRLLSSTLGAGCRVRYMEEPEGLPALVRGDRRGLEGAIMNLAVNARDAMPGGGDVVIRLAPERVTPHGDDDPDRPSAAAELAPGLYVRISVTDTGGGMSPEVLARVGEPFFTTKPRGKGTGLGLAGARGFAQGAGGGFHVNSAQGVGTTVTLWLPADQSHEGEEDQGESPDHHEKVL
jgi:signal transduction histidine kinase